MNVNIMNNMNNMNNMNEIVLLNNIINVPLFITLLIALLLVVCHIFFSDKNIFSQNSMVSSTTTTTTNETISKHPKHPKIVVFDMDETLGSFGEIGIFWDALEEFYGKNLFNDTFYNLLDTFPEFLRPNIINILNYLKEKKNNNECEQIMIYTNNQGPKSWGNMIKNYFNQRCGVILFDKIIAAFKIGDKIIEMNRTSHTKSVEDLIRCTKIMPNTEICFIDDQFHSLMKHENVYYINVKPFLYSMPFHEMAERYYHVNKDKDEEMRNNTKEEFVRFITEYMNKYNYNVIEKDKVEIEIDIIISKKIMTHLEDFFKKKYNTNTRKKRTIKPRVTRKRIL